MAFLTDLDKKLSRFGQDALKKTRDVSESVRMSGVIKEEEAKQAELYKLLGEYFYKNYAAVAEEPMKAWCEEIKKSKDAVTQYQEQIRIMKGITNCPNCHAEIATNAVFCNNCGIRVNVQEDRSQVPPVSGKTCPTCGVPINDVQLFCTNCGGKIPQETAAPVPPAMNYASVQPEADYSASAPEMNPYEVERPEFEFSMIEPEISDVYEPQEPSQVQKPSSEGFFVQQDLSFGGSSQPVYGETAAAQEPGDPVCPNCGQMLNEGQAFCTNCGTRL